MSIPLLTWSVPRRTVHHTQSDKRLGRSVFQCSEECCILHFLLGPVFQNHHHPKKTPNLTNIKLQVKQWSQYSHVLESFWNRILLPSSVKARVWASLLPQATWMTRWPRSTLTYKTEGVRKKFPKKLCLKTLQTFSRSYDHLGHCAQAERRTIQAMLRIQHCYIVASSCVSKQM